MKLRNLACAALLAASVIAPAHAATPAPYPSTWGTVTEQRCMTAIGSQFGFVKPTVAQQRTLSTFVRMHGSTPCRAFLSSRRSVGRY